MVNCPASAIGIKIAAAKGYARITIKTSTQLITSDTWSRSVSWSVIVIGLILSYGIDTRKRYFYLGSGFDELRAAHAVHRAQHRALHRGKLAVKQWSGWLHLFPTDIHHPFLLSLYLASHVNATRLSDEYQSWPFLGTNCGAPYTTEGGFVSLWGRIDLRAAIETRESRERFLVSPYGERQMCTLPMKIPVSWMKRSRRRRRIRATEFSLRIRHPNPRFCCFWDPRHDEESRTTDLPDIPASEHRRQNLDASRLRVREFRGRRSIAGQQTGIEVSQVLLMGGIKKWAAPWMCRGPI
ncbi:hypothetical protein G5I_00696 [Acromyrmex echinatior]|uniref:Uncharacterized protein n=1 Tax=Acromyrmex echinatior TaxID=103372 RepID=F4W5J9_ACREC|nr:hypothetical protein G5I_00696 [Acromyrmex echinatior]